MNNQPDCSFSSSSCNLSNIFLGTLYTEECFARPGTGRRITAISNTLSDYGLPEKIDSPEQSDEIINSDNTLESLVQSCQYCDNVAKRSQEMPTKHQCEDAIGCSHLPFHPNKSTSKKSKSFLLARNKTCSKFQQKEHLSGSNAVSKKATKTKKKRIKWNDDLHKKFVENMHLLGGPRKATPKGILKMMNCEEMTLFHVKSHLQKYRSCQHMPEETIVPCLGVDKKIALEIVEVLKMQRDVQRRLNEQIENQNRMQTQIEEQSKLLHAMIRSQLKTDDTCLSLNNQ